MDRLPTVAAAALPVMLAGLLGCGADTVESSSPSRSRVNAVEAKPAAKVDLSDFCEHSAPAESAQSLVWPQLRTPQGKGEGKARWINVWATWCKPCVAELPRIAAWRQTLSKRVDYEMIFVSADSEVEEVDAFKASHPEVAATLQLADADALQGWLSGLGVTGGGLPVHLFVDNKDRVRCVRMSEIGDDDLGAVTAVLESL